MRRIPAAVLLLSLLKGNLHFCTRLPHVGLKCRLVCPFVGLKALSKFRETPARQEVSVTWQFCLSGTEMDVLLIAACSYANVCSWNVLRWSQQRPLSLCFINNVHSWFRVLYSLVPDDLVVFCFFKLKPKISVLQNISASHCDLSTVRGSLTQQVSFQALTVCVVVSQ